MAGLRISKQVDSVIAILEDMAASNRIWGLVVGYTAQPAVKRRRQYQGRGDFKDMVVLVDSLTRDQALDIEAAVHDALLKLSKRSRVSKKWNAYKRANLHKKADGGGSPDADALIHKVYVAWSTKEQTEAE